ncbi:hypothetical protein niasHS_013813 [Heterodera schachtii]|uniref:Uncharacterized protein n=1 Tax=Heterodera schachtii TaxID=97005 RepID=A0ABD2IRP1_HETSC
MLIYQQFLLICSLFLWDVAFGGVCFSRPNTSSSNSAPAQVMRGGGGSSRRQQIPSPQWQRQKVPRNRAKNSTPRTSAAPVNPYEYANRTSSLSRTHSEEAIGDFISYAKNTNEPGFKLGIRQPPVKPKPYRPEQIQKLIENKKYLTSKSYTEDYVEQQQNANSMALRQSFNDKMPNGRGGRMKDKMPMEMNSPRPRRRNGTGSHRGETSQNLGEKFRQAESRADQMDRSASQNRQRQRTEMARQKSLKNKESMDKLWQEFENGGGTVKPPNPKNFTNEETSKLWEDYSNRPSLNEKQFDKLWEDFNEKDKEEALAVEMNAKIGKKHRKSANKKPQNAEASQSSNDSKMGTKKVNGESAKKGKSGGAKKKQKSPIKREIGIIEQIHGKMKNAKSQSTKDYNEKIANELDILW